jgi:hypothetical protein
MEAPDGCRVTIRHSKPTRKGRGEIAIPAAIGCGPWRSLQTGLAGAGSAMALVFRPALKTPPGSGPHAAQRGAGRSIP